MTRARGIDLRERVVAAVGCCGGKADGGQAVGRVGRGLHGCWPITYPLAGWLGARVGMGPTFAVLAMIAAASVVLALAVWPATGEDPVPHRHEDLPPDHPHLREGNHARGHAHPAIVDDLHPQWSRLA